MMETRINKNMTAHELAWELLKGPDVEVLVAHSDDTEELTLNEPIISLDSYRGEKREMKQVIIIS